MADDIDTVFFWETKEDRQPNKCRIRICWITWEKAIIIATDITDRPGRKIANVTKELIGFASNIYDLVPNKTMLVEHYLTSNLPDGDIYLQVLITNKETVRYEIDKCWLTQLLGKSI